MTDFDETHLRAALRDLHDAALPGITPPGLPAVQRKVRRRIAARTTLIAVLGVLLLSLVLVAPGRRPPPPPVEPSPSSSSHRSASPSPSPSASTVAEGAAGSATCDNRPVPTAPDGFQAWGRAVTFWLVGNGPICPDVRTLVTWVTYEHITGGLQRVYASESFWLAPGQQHTTVVRYNPSCRGDLYYLLGDIAVLPTIPAVTTDPLYPLVFLSDSWSGWFSVFPSGPQFCSVLADVVFTPQPSESGSEPPP